MDWRKEVRKYVSEVERQEGVAGPLYNLDVKGMLSRPEPLYAVITEIGDLILKEHEHVKAIGSHGVGGSFLISPIILHAYNHWFNVNGFFIRFDEPEGREHPTIEGCLESGWRVLIIDTVIKSGASGLRAHEMLKAYGCEVESMIVIADLSGGDNACTQAGLKVESLITL